MLDPSEAVRANPLSIMTITDDFKVEIVENTITEPGTYFIVDKAFLMWTWELKEEVARLRKLVK